MSKTDWTKEEEEILKEWYPLIGITVNPSNSNSLMEMLNRSKYSIKRKAIRLGLKRDNQNFWTKEEVVILKKWYPLIGYRNSKIRRMLKIQSMTDLIPNKSQENIVSKAFRLGIRRDPQKGLPKGHIRCSVCLKVYTSKKYMASKGIYCKSCHSKSQTLYLKDDIIKRYATKLRHRYYQETNISPDFNEICNTMKEVFNKNKFECFFKDEYCNHLWAEELSIGHLNPVDKNKPEEIIYANNLFFLCMQHNQVMLDVKFDDLKELYSSMIKKYDKYYNK